MKKILMLLLISLFVCSCGNDDEDEVGIETVNISGSNLETIENIQGKYFILKNLNDLTYTRCIYIPFSEKEQSFAAEASLNNRVSEPILQMKEGTTNVLFLPGINAEFSLETGKPLNNEANGKTIKVYKVSYDKKNDSYRLVHENK